MKKNKALYGILLSISGVIVAAPAPANEPGFDFINKSGKTLTILVNNGYKNILQAVVKPATTIFGKVITANNVSATIDINEPTLLVVYEGAFPNIKVEPFRPRGGDEGTPAFFYDWMVHGPKTKTYMYTFKLGKKAYVTLHEKGNLNPQTGPSSGAKGVTDAGYSLQNEVSQSDIMRANEAYMGL